MHYQSRQMTPNNELYTTHKTDIRLLLSVMKRNKENDVRLFTYVALFIQVFFEIFSNSSPTVGSTKEVGRKVHLYRLNLFVHGFLWILL